MRGLKELQVYKKAAYCNLLVGIKYALYLLYQNIFIERKCKCHTCGCDDVGLVRLEHAICMAWLARANWFWSTNPGRPGSDAGSAMPTK